MRRKKGKNGVVLRCVQTFFFFFLKMKGEYSTSTNAYFPNTTEILEVKNTWIIFDIIIYHFLADYKEELLKWVPAEILPEAYGGTLKDSDGDPRCPSKVGNVKKKKKKQQQQCHFVFDVF